MDRNSLQELIIEALKAQGGCATIVDVCKYVWANHENRLKTSGDLFYTWQYDIRWAATKLRKNGMMKPAEASEPGVWELAK